MSERYPGGFITKTPPTPSVASAQGIWTLDQALQNIRAGTWPYPPQSDAQWNYVTALFAGTSTSGAQNNTFLDSSSNGFTITRNGNTTQGSFSPYQTNGYWSNFFNGSSDYLTLPASASWLFTGDACLEAWVFWTTSQASIIFATGNASSADQFGIFPGGEGIWWGVTSQASNVVPTLNAWNHVCVTRQGSTIRRFLNGQLITTDTNSGSIGSNSATAYVGRRPSGGVDFPGYISQLRIVNGSVPTAYQTSSTTINAQIFTPSTTPFTTTSQGATAGDVKLLMCQSNRFVDNSASPNTITVNGTPSVQDFSPVGNPTPYSPQTIGGSGYFDGSGDSLALSSTSIDNFGTGDFTVEAWIYCTTVSTNNPVVVDQTTAQFAFGIAPSNYLYYGTSDTADILSSSTINGLQNSWRHIAISRTSGTSSLYLDGTRVATGSDSTNWSSGGLWIGRRASGAAFNGYISNVRVVKGTGLYSGATITVPTAPLTAVTNTSLLCSFTNAGIFDAAAANNAETVGNAQVSTTVMKYGPSLSFDGSGDYLRTPNAQNFTFGTGNFTIEMWLYYSSSATGSDFLIDCRPAATNGAYPTIYVDTGVVYYYANSGNRITSSAISSNTWTHIAVSRVGTSTSMFINGVQSGATYTDSTNYICRSDGPVIGADRNLADSLLGYIYDLRVTKGYARYWYPFTPPLVPMGTYYAPEVLPAADPLFEYVTMLLPGNGTNGAQNNTFTDSSNNAFTITRNGNTTQGTFSPYGSNWSVSFGTSSTDYLSASSSSSFAFGTGDFTMEAFVFATASQTDNWIIGLHGNCWFRIGSGGALEFYNNIASSSIIAGSAMPTNQWVHVAAVRSGTTLTIYQNGVSVASGTVSTNFSTSVACTIGNQVGFDRRWNGYISNVRLVKGSAVYTSAFTPSTTPLTAVTNTVLLTCQSNRYVDNSASPFTLTVSGSPSVQRFSPFAPTAAYSTATIGGSGYFDGSGDYLSLAGDAAFAFGTGDFTVECWINTSTTTSDTFYRRIWMTDGPTGNASGNFQISLVPTTGYVNLWDSVLDISGTSNVCDGAWHHIAATRSGTTLRLFVDGVQQASTTYSTSVSPNSGSPRPWIGSYDGSQGDFSGYISNLRVLKGTAQYTANFTPPTAPLTAITNTSLLTNFTNAGIIDNAMMNDLETVGNAQISTTQSKFGGSSLYFDGSGYLAGASTPNTNIDSGDFTFEAWVYLPDASVVCPIVAKGFGSAGGYMMWVQSTLRVRVYNAAGSQFTATSSLSISNNTWTYIAGVRSGNTITLYINGVADGSVSYSGTSTNSSRIEVGGYNSGTVYLNGYIDDLRITKGIARYVQNFTPPTQAFQTS